MKRVKKAQDGEKIIPIKRVGTPDLRTGQYRRLGRLSAKNPTKAKKVAKRMVEKATRTERGEQYLKKNVGKFMPDVPEVGKKGAKVVAKAKKGGSFPDLNKDGKITKADILKGRGVIAKGGSKVKKAQFGALFGKRDCGPGGCGKPRGAERRASKKALKAVRTPRRFAGGGKCRYGC